MAQDASIASLYSLQSKGSDSWGIPGYEICKKYEDPILLKRQRDLSAGKIRSPKATKRGHYLDDLAKSSVAPGPNKYNVVKPWVDDQSKSPKKNYPQRKTYIDDISHNEKKHKFPPPNAYNVTETEEQMKLRLAKLSQKHIKPLERLTYLDTIQYEADKMPGPGLYTPHEIQNRRQGNTANFIKDKKKPQSPPKHPEACTYDPVIMDTFAARSNFPRHFTQKKNNFGTQKRWPELQKSRSKSPNKENKLVVPGPGKYDVLNNWKGKDTLDKKRSLFRIISTGVLKSVYY